MKNLGKLAAGIAFFALGGIFAENANALLITTTKICDAATEDCAGNPETDIYKVTLDRTGGTDTSFDIDWLIPKGTVGDSALPIDLKGSSTWTVNSFTDSEIELGINISNNTVLQDTANTNAAILSFGFGVDPDSSASLTTAGNVFGNVGEGNGPQQTFPGGFKQIDVCIFSDGCSGGSINTGLQASNDPDVGSGQYSMDTLVVTIKPDLGSYGDTVDLLFFPSKWQSTWGSFEPGGVPGGQPPVGGNPPGVPEPGILWLLATGLLGLRFTAKKLG